VTGYDALAAHYDRFWGDRMTPYALRAIGELVLPKLPLPVERAPRVLDLCCGTGQLAAVLADRGWDVVGVDASEAMLAHARRRAPHARFVRADARALDASIEGSERVETAPREGNDAPAAGFDLCVSAFDSLNHVLEPDDLSAVFEGVLHRLAPGGAFLFDLNGRRGFLERFQGGFDLDDGELACRVEASFDAAAGIGRYDVVLRGRVGEAPIVLQQRCYAAADVVARLRAAGFRRIRVRDAQRDLGMAGHVGRQVFTAWRPQGA